MKAVDTIKYEDPFEIVELADKAFNAIDGSYPVVNIYAKFNEIKEIFKAFICLDYDINGFVELFSYDIDGYDKEYVLGVTKDGLTLEKIYDEDAESYLYSECDVAFIHEDCSSKLLLEYIDSDVYVSMEECGECDECELFTKCDGCCMKDDEKCDDEDEVKKSKSDFSKKECVKENVKEKDDKTVHEMHVSDDSHGFTVSDYTDHGYHSFSFYSSDSDFVSEMMKLFR